MSSDPDKGRDEEESEQREPDHVPPVGQAAFRLFGINPHPLPFFIDRRKTVSEIVSFLFFLLKLDHKK
jgi:hypothetical protein